MYTAPDMFNNPVPIEQNVSAETPTGRSSHIFDYSPMALVTERVEPPSGVL